MTALRKPVVEDEADENSPSLTAAFASATSEVSHNLNGQRLGRKGRVTRERILAATLELLENSGDEPISLSAVARKVPLGMTSLYNYFSDLTELLLAVLEPVIASSEDAFMGMLRERWPDEELGARCEQFLWAYYDFWTRHSRLLHLRNSMADSGDERMMLHRVHSSMPVIALFAEQMGGGYTEEFEAPASAMATVLMTGMERTVTVATDTRMLDLLGSGPQPSAERYLKPEARLLELAIRDTREAMADRKQAD